jgi:SAM-dependent methyltransferase
MVIQTPEFPSEIAQGQRFQFGRNWQRFLSHLDERRIAMAKESLQRMLAMPTLAGLTFLDVGCGSGLFSLAARELGARVHSFDYDPQSVACAQYLKEKYFPQDTQWSIRQGSIIDLTYLGSLATSDIVYSWGVLHHTGALWESLANVATLVKPGGRLFIAVYNDQGWISRYWKWVKRRYNSGALQRRLMILLYWPYLFCLRLLIRTLTGKGQLQRGMSLWFDMLDWLGGYPFEVAAPTAIVEFFQTRGFIVQALKTCGHRHGCNEYVFRRI